MTTSQPARRFFFLLLGATAVLMALVVRPLATPLFLATVLAVVLWPVHRLLTVRLGNRLENLASALVVLGVILLLVAPIAGLSAYIVKEAREGVSYVSSVVRSEGLGGLAAKLPEPLERHAKKLLASFPAPEEGELNEKVLEQVGAQGGSAVAVVGAAAKATGSFLFQTAMMLVALYFLLLHGNDLVSWLDEVLPLRKGQTRELLAEFKAVSYAVVVSTTGSAAIQALAALVGFFIARVPHPLFFGAVTFFVAFIPAIGAASVCLLAALFLLVSGHPYMAAFLAAWGLAVVGLVDNLVKPLLMRSGTRMSGAVVFFALIGGLGAFGAVGLLIGPLVVALFLALLRIYERDFKKSARA